MKLKYNHAYDFAFEIISEHEGGDDVTPEMLRDACIARIKRCYKDGELDEACGRPFDTYTMPEETGHEETRYDAT